MKPERQRMLAELALLTAMAACLGCATSNSVDSALTETGGEDSEPPGACPGATLCGDHCTNIASDPDNCGKCGNACAAGEVCSVGLCAVVCSGGSTQCDDRCVDIASDPENCGACGKACAPAELCSAAQCSQVCLGGTIN